jgi:WD40 repeat protein
MDHTIRIHDLAAGTNLNTIHGAKPATQIAPHLLYDTNPLILGSYPDHIIRLYDTRITGKAQIFKSHKAWVRGIQWIQKSVDSNSFISWGDDNHLKIWDLRSAVPVHSFKHNDGEQNKWISDWKVLAACSIEDGILSGGSDCMLKKHLV